MRVRSLSCFLAIVAALDVTALPMAMPALAQEHLTVHGLTHDALEDRLISELGDHQFDTLPRWNRRVCVDIHGVQDQFAELLFEHLKAVGGTLGLSLTRDCVEKRLFIFFTDRSDDLAAGIQKLNPDLFIGLDSGQEYQENKTEATPDEVRQFLRPRAVRWLTSSVTRSKDDSPPIIMPPGFPVRYAAPVTDSGLDEVTTRRDMTIVLIIVDISRLKDEPWGRLGDLVSVIAFTAPHLRDGYDGQTLLRYTQAATLQGPTEAMPPYDRAVMTALYALPDDYDLSDGINWMASHLSAEARSQ